MFAEHKRVFFGQEN